MAPVKIDARPRLEEVVTIQDSADTSPAAVPPHSPAASVSPLGSEDEEVAATGDADATKDYAEDSDSSLSLLDVSAPPFKPHRNVLPAKVSQERNTSNMFARVVGELDARDATVRLSFANREGGPVETCRIISADGNSIRTACMESLRVLILYVRVVPDVFDMTGFSDRKRAALKEFEARYDESHRMSSIRPLDSTVPTPMPDTARSPHGHLGSASPAAQTLGHLPPHISPYGSHNPYAQAPYGAPQMPTGPYYPPGFLPVSHHAMRHDVSCTCTYT